ncbi:unnamed protein product, partial [marine sediment metagenome]
CSPEIESTFSLWMLDSKRFGKWTGYEGPQTVLNSDILPPEVMLCVHGEPGVFNFAQVRRIAQTGRRVGVWAWYLASNEIYPSMYVCTGQSASHFGDLPVEAHETATWHSVDSNNHGLNLQNLFLAGQLMQDPTADVSQAIEEFITGALGAENVNPVREVLETIEAVRPLWPEKYGDDAIDLDRTRRAHELMKRVTVREGFEPSFPMVFSPCELAAELAAQTKVMVSFAEFCAAAGKLEQAPKNRR